MMKGCTRRPTTISAVDRAARDPDTERHRQPDRKRRRRPHRPDRPQHERRRHPGQRVDRPDGQIDAARDDHDRGADRHDREEARVGGSLNQRVRVEEVVDLGSREPIDVRTRKHGQEQTERWR